MVFKVKCKACGATALAEGSTNDETGEPFVYEDEWPLTAWLLPAFANCEHAEYEELVPEEELS